MSSASVNLGSTVSGGGGGGSGTVTQVNGNAPLSVVNETTTPVISISEATTSTNGYLSSTDWNTFNNKQSALTLGNLTDGLTDGITITGGTGAVVGSGTSITQQVATTSQNGYLASTDWTTFNNKQAALTFSLPLLNTANTISANIFGGDSGSGGTQGIVPAPAAASYASGDFLSASGSFAYVDQSKTIYPTFSLITQGAVPSGAIKYESTVLYTSIVTGKQYALGVGFIGSPTLTIWDISDQTRPVLTGTFVASGGGAYNATVGVVSGVQYAFVGYNSGSHFVVINLTNPFNPVQTSSTVITGSPGSIYGVSFLNGYVYCATQSTGLVVMDVGGGTGSPTTPVQTYQQAGGTKSFGVVAIGSNVYTTSYSTSSPYTVRQIISWTLTSPGSASVPSLLQSLQVTAAGEALGLSVSGSTAFVTTAATGAYNINLVDITTPSSMTNLSQVNSTNTFNSAFFAVGSGNYMYVPSGGNVTYGGAIDVYDITTRTAPLHISQVTTNNASSVFGGIAISGGYIFCADYGTSAGTSGFFDVFQDIRETLIVGAETVSQLTVLGSMTGAVNYSPNPSSNWATSNPTSLQNAMDRIATLVKTLNLGMPIP